MVQAFWEVSAMKYAGTPGCGKINGLLPAGHDDPYHALVLPHEREEEIQPTDGMKTTAAFKAADRNPYSWNMEFCLYPDDSGYEARFSQCGICTLMRELGLFDLVPAMCALDYSMSEVGGASHFVRECTIANGDDYCDCGYKRRS